MNKMKSARGESHGSPKKLHHIEVHPSENDGHTIKHVFENSGPGEYHEPKDHVFSSGEGSEAMEHIASAANIKSSEPSEAEGEDTGENESA